jgi:CheY-like chemotaxis protein
MPYEITCLSCRASFDAVEAPWCGCLSKERTVVCPQCGACFCKAPRSHREKFWAAAPEALWDRKFAAHLHDFKPRENPPPESVKRPLVLIVDDEPEVLQAAIHAVEALGYATVVARNGVEGIELARSYKPDLVLSDAFMPRMDGREMCRKLKEDAATARIPIVVMTSLYTSSAHKYEAKGAFRVDEFLTKPLDVASLASALKRLLG